MKIYKSKADQSIIDWQWYEPSLRNITNLILKYSSNSGGNALDVGCGTGRVSFALEKKGYDVEGIDIEGRVIELARKKAKDIGSKVRFDVADGSNSNMLRKNFYDLVVCSEVLEHIIDYHPLIENMHTALKPGGRIIITVPFDPKKWSILDEYGGHVRRFTFDKISADLSRFNNLNITVTGFPFYRMLVRVYLIKNKLFGLEHSNEELWGKTSTRVVASLMFPFIRLDNLFAFTRLGDALIVAGEKCNDSEKA